MNNNIKYKLMYVFTFAPVGVLCPLIGQYLSSIGFSGTEIGTITAAGTGMSVLASVFWGDRYSNSRDGRKVILSLCFFAAIMSIVNSFVTSFIVFVFTYALMYFFQGPVMGLCDAMMLERNQNFAPIRLCGSAGYALAVFLGGRLGEKFGLGSIFIIYTVTYLISVVVISTIKSTPHSIDDVVKEKKERIKYTHLLSEKKGLALIICGIFVFGSNVANNTYFSFLFKDGGGTVAGVGTAFLLMVGSEVPFMALAPKLASKITSQKLIAVAMVISILRCALYASGPSHIVLMATFFLPGIVNGILLVEYVRYLSSVVKPELIGISVSAFYAITSNGGTILCNFFGGVAMDFYGSTGVYVLFGALNIVSLAMYLICGLHKTKSF